MKIILTGGTGFIGSKILSKLAKYNFEILIFSRKKIKSKKNIRYIQCDLFKPKSYLNKIKQFSDKIYIIERGENAWNGKPSLLTDQIIKKHLSV